MTLNEWKGFEITQEVVGAIKNLRAYAIEQLAESAGIDPLKDRWLCGAIAAYNDFLDIQIEEPHGN